MKRFLTSEKLSLLQYVYECRHEDILAYKGYHISAGEASSSSEGQRQTPLTHATSLHFDFHFSLYTISSSKLEEIVSSILSFPWSAFEIKASKGITHR